MKQLDRSKAIIQDNKIIIDEDSLDIFDVWEGEIPEWSPKVSVKPFSELSGYYIDIETEGLDPQIHKIVLIGLISNQGEISILDSYRNERLSILKLFQIIQDPNLDFVATFNGTRLTSHPETGFDWWFIMERCKILNLSHPFWICPHEKIFRTAQLFSTPIRYHDLYLNGGKTAVIDLYHQLLAWDFVARKLTKYNLKDAPTQMGLRKEDRVTLTYEEMVECMTTENWDRLREYLTHDLLDSKILGDVLIPSLYYEKLYHPDWKFHKLTTAGNGSKWNDLLVKSYGKNAKADDKKSFQGALTFSIPGLFYNCIKLDVESLYPHMMLIYGIHSIKDSKATLLSILAYLLKFRVGLKRKKEDRTITQTEKQQEGTAKVKLNSGYGALATSGIDYNDMVSAAFVTAYGRATYKHIFKKLKSIDFCVIQGDTDGLIFSCGKTILKSLENLGYKLIKKQYQISLQKIKYRSFLDLIGKRAESFINDSLPGNDLYRVKVKFELSADAVYVPKDLKTGEALRKNYLIFSEGQCTTKKGKYKKRDRSVLEKSFQIEFLERVIYSEMSSALDYYVEQKNLLENGSYPVDSLSITRKIKVTENALVEAGIGQRGEVHTFYEGKEGKTKEGEYNPIPYLKKLNEMFKEIMSVL